MHRDFGLTRILLVLCITNIAGIFVRRKTEIAKDMAERVLFLTRSERLRAIFANRGCRPCRFAIIVSSVRRCCGNRAGGRMCGMRAE